MCDLLDLDAIRVNATHADADTVTALADENERLRRLLAQAKPFLLHNGLLLRLGVMGIAADPEYTEIAREQIERLTAWAVKDASGDVTVIDGGLSEIQTKHRGAEPYSRTVVRSHFRRTA